MTRLSPEQCQRRELAMVATEAAMAKETDAAVYARLERRNALLVKHDQEGASYSASGVVGWPGSPEYRHSEASPRLDELLTDPERPEGQWSGEEWGARARLRVERLADLLWLGDVDAGLWTPTDDFANCAEMPWWCERLSTWMVTMAKARATWPRGPWDDEPDRRAFITQVGLPGLIVRREDGVLCGYVAGIPENRSALVLGDYLIIGLSHCSSIVCHLPARDEHATRPWLGFHCGGERDIIPGGPDRTTRMRYRDLAYVRQLVEDMAHRFTGADALSRNRPLPPPPPPQTLRGQQDRWPTPPPNDRRPSPGYLDGDEGGRGRTGPPRYRK